MKGETCAALCDVCGRRVAHCSAVYDAMCDDTIKRCQMRYRSAIAAGLNATDASYLSAQTGPMFYQPKDRICAPE